MKNLVLNSNRWTMCATLNNQVDITATYIFTQNEKRIFYQEGIHYCTAHYYRDNI